MEAELTEQAPNRRVPNLLHFLLFLCLTLMATFVVEALAALVLWATHLGHWSDQRVQLVLSAVAYGVTLGAAYVLFPAMWGPSFLDGIRWNGKGAKVWLAGFGLVLGFAAEFISSFLPTPRDMPIEKIFETPGIVWFLVVFGTVLAPLFEEITFRGLLLPALANAYEWLRLPHAKSAESEVAHGEWRRTDGVSRGGLVVASLLTSVLFALIHAPQLGFNWAPVGLLVCVSLALCVVRIRTGSVAASTLVHGFYNMANFVLIFVATGGFRHMDRS